MKIYYLLEINDKIYFLKSYLSSAVGGAGSEVALWSMQHLRHNMEVESTDTQTKLRRWIWIQIKAWLKLDADNGATGVSDGASEVFQRRHLLHIDKRRWKTLSEDLVKNSYNPTYAGANCNTCPLWKLHYLARQVMQWYLWQFPCTTVNHTNKLTLQPYGDWHNGNNMVIFIRILMGDELIPTNGSVQWYRLD